MWLLVKDKTHLDYAYELDLIVKPDSKVPLFGREFGAFSGAGVPLFSVGGGAFRSALSEILVGFHARRGYYPVETPMIASAHLFEVSGHLEFYRENMYLFDIEGHEFAVKPMNCPYHILIFMNEVAKYRGKVPLPFKVFEVGRVHRYEPSGSVYGLLRVRAFTQDDAHIITPGENAEGIVYSIFEEMRLLLEKLFHIAIDPENFKIRLSMAERDKIGKEYMGSPKEWVSSERVLEDAVKRIRDEHGIEYVKLEGEAAFYGPKIDFIVTVEESGIRREWQLGTIQFDFNLPRRFRLYDLIEEVYGFKDIYIIHRALLGSIERFLGAYLEHSKGRLPFILSPLQFAIIAVRSGSEVDREVEAVSGKILDELVSRGFRAGLKVADKTGLSSEVRHIEYTIKPYIMVFIGPREIESGTLDVRVYDLESRKRRQEKVSFTSIKEAVESLEALAGSLEAGVRDLAGVAPRIPIKYSFVL